MKYLLTGGAGFIGAALTRRLAADGHEVTVLTPGPARRLTGGPQASHIIHGDVRSLEAVAAAMQGCESVIHLAYVQRNLGDGYANSADVVDVAVRGMAAVLQSCTAQRVSELMLISSPEVYQAEGPAGEDVPLVVPDVLNLAYSHGGGKIAQELMAAAWATAKPGRRLIIARPHNVYGPDMGTEHVIPQFCAAMNVLDASVPPPARIAFPVRGTGEEARSFCWIGDCVDQLALLLRKADTPGIYHVGVMDEWSIAELAGMVAACYGREITVIPGAAPDGMPRRRVPDTTKIEALGWDASSALPLLAGLDRTVDWYRHG